MKKILILGANGFIGRHLSATLKKSNSYYILTHCRNEKYLCDFSFKYRTKHFQSLLKEVDIIINCTGIGLSKLYKTSDRNLKLTNLICKDIMASKTKAIIIHFSSIKAYNPSNYDDIYSYDKAQSERLFYTFNLIKRSCIIRIPIITGIEDLNILPFLLLAQKITLPLVNSCLPRLNILSIDSLSAQVVSMMHKSCNYLGKIVYILNTQDYTWNDLVSIKKTNHSYTISLSFIKLLWKLCSVQNLFIKDRVPFPIERFYDLFLRNWQYEEGDKIIFTYINDDVLSLVKRMYEKSNEII